MSLTGNANKLLRLHRNKLLLEQTSASALDTVHIIVHLVGTVERNVQDSPRGQGVEFHGRQSRADNQLARLVARRHVAGVGGVDTESLDRLDDVDDRGAAADADPASVFWVMVGDGGLCGGALGGFDGVGHGRVVTGEVRGEGESRLKTKMKVEAGRLRKRSKTARRGEAERREQSGYHGERVQLVKMWLGQMSVNCFYFWAFGLE